MKFSKSITLLSISVISLSACGGGSGGGSTASTGTGNPEPVTQPQTENKDPFENPRTISKHSGANFKDMISTGSECNGVGQNCTAEFSAKRAGRVVIEEIDPQYSTSTPKKRIVNDDEISRLNYGRVGTNVGDEWYVGGAFYQSFGERGNIYGAGNYNDALESFGEDADAKPVETNTASSWTWANIVTKTYVATKDINEERGNALAVQNNSGSISFDTQSGDWNATFQNGEISLDGNMEGHNVGGTATFSVNGTTYATGNFGGADGLINGKPVTGGAFAGQNDGGNIFFGGIWETNENSALTAN